MDKESVLELLGDGGAELGALKNKANVLADFVTLIEAVDKAKAMDRRIQENGLSLYQAISKDREIQVLEGVLEKFFGKPVKPAGEPVPDALQRTHTYKHFKSIQESQSLFIRKIGNTELYGILLPWPNKENIITVHLGACNPQMPEHEYQKLVHLVNHRLMQKVSLQVESSLGGQLQGASLSTLLQMSEMEGTSAILHIKSADKAGTLYLENGQLVDAETQDLKHLEAALEIIGWDNPSIEIEKTTSPTERHIQVPLMQILIESMNQKDGRELPQGNSSGPVEQKRTAAPVKDEDDAGALAKKPFAGQTGMLGQGEIVPLEIQELQSESAGEAAEEGKKKDPAKEEHLVDLDLVDTGDEDKKRPGQKSRWEKPPSATLRPKRRKLKLLIAAVALVVAAGGAFFGYRLMTREPEPTAYEKVLAQLSQTTDWGKKEKLLIDFIERHEGGEDTAKAEVKLKEIWVEAEDAAYRKTIDQVFNLPMDASYEKNAFALYEKFLEKYPSTRYRSEIEKSKARIYELSDDFDFSQLRNIDSQKYIERLEACEGYLAKHPNGSHRKAATALIHETINDAYQSFAKDIKKCEMAEAWTDCIRLCDEYISKFQTYMVMEPIRRIKRNMEAQQDYNTLISTVADTDDKTAKKHYLAYLAQYPETEKKDEIRAAVAMIDQRAKDAAEWAAIRHKVQQSPLSVEAKIDALQTYILERPAEVYLQAARDLLHQLEDESRKINQERYRSTRKETTQYRAEEETREQQASRLQLKREKARIEKAKQRLIGLLRQGGRFVVAGNDVVTDQRTGLMWSLPDSYLEQKKCMDHRTALEYVKDLRYGGYSDWRLPTSGELAGIYKNSPFFPSGGADWYWSSDSFARGYHEEANIVTSKPETVYKTQSVNTRECGHVRAVRP